MTETLFAFDEENYQQCQQAYRGDKDQEYYLGDYRIEAGAHIEVRAEKKTVGASSIICLHSKNRLFFQRSWSHIREDATDVTVLWFVNNGSLEVTHSGGSIRAVAGRRIPTASNQLGQSCQCCRAAPIVSSVIRPRSGGSGWRAR